jgi:iron complex outermembrane receptor protein
MFYKSPVNEGNPNLLPEYAWNYEVGFKTKGISLIQAEVGIFYRDGSNMIDWVRATDEDAWKPINILSLNMSGFDTNIVLKLNEFMPKVFSSAAVNYTYINAQTGAIENGQSRYALENLKHQFRFTLGLAYGKKITHTISAGYYNRVNLEDYSVVDTRVTYQAKKLKLFIDITNIFDVSYQETNLVIMPGRWAKAGVSFDIF